jgi:hypothetical protein
MKLSLGALLLVSQLSSALSFLDIPQTIFNNAPDAEEQGFRIPTVRESAAMARKILRLEKIGTLSTQFPIPKHGEVAAEESRPTSVEGLPFGLMDYFADCEPTTGNPTILALTIASSFRNVAAGSNITLSLRWHPHYTHFYSAAKYPRFALVGTLEDITDEEAHAAGIKTCFSKYHPDSVVWQPGNRIHEARWVRFVTKEIYWLGGFGDRAYIGWIPLDVWQDITEEEIKNAKLEGEKKNFWDKWLGSYEL